MKFLLQQKATGLFLSRSLDWEFDPGEAREFQSAADAIKYCVATDTWEVDLVLRFPHPTATIDVPLQDASFSVTPHVARVHTNFQRQSTFSTG